MEESVKGEKSYTRASSLSINEEHIKQVSLNKNDENMKL